jgi:hypothetical protein
MKYILGLALDFTILAQRLSEIDHEAKGTRVDLDESALFLRYELITERAGTQANTLSLRFEDAEVGIRQIEESVTELFHQLKRPGYPSAYVYNTGQWHKYKDLLIDCFRLSEAGRFELCKRLIIFGLDNMSIADFYGRATPRVFLLLEIIEFYGRKAKGENAGLTYQALAYGIFEADRPHLSIVTDKVRRGSKRQKMIGDVDCYSGIDLELSVEVKDLHITTDNLISELGEFIQSIVDSKAPGLVFLASIDIDALRELEAHGIQVLHIEQNPNAVQRLLAFIQERDKEHNALIYYIDGSES